MRTSLVAIMTGATLAVVAFTAFPAEAQRQSRAQVPAPREYPWCARYDWTTSNCGFVSFQQCLDTVRGIGGICEINPRYNPPRERRPRR